MIVQVKQGRLEGLTQRSVLTGDKYYAYLGIPYAHPPVGELRFQPPQPIEKWDGTLSAKQEGSPCIQQDFSGKYIGSEDCLYLNVFTPNSPNSNASLKAVMVFIHGGAFTAGSGSTDLYSPDYLISHDIILVTLNYRLHVLGFLNMKSKNSAENCGLRDQCLAIKWVNENIREFGGDPGKITIFGDSAGGFSVYLHILSPMSSGLFSKAIIQSDIAYSKSIDHNFDSKQLKINFAKKLGSEETDPEKLVEFLRYQPAMKIVKSIPSIFDRLLMEENIMDPRCIAFGPSVEFIKENAFIPDTIENMKKTATPVPLIIGFNSKEGRLAYSTIGSNLVEALKKNFTWVIEQPSKISSSDFKILCDKIKKQYLGDEDVSEKTAEKLVDLYTDYWYQHFYKEFDFICSSKIPVYIYEFSYFGKFNIFQSLYKINSSDSRDGAAHADELPYLFLPKKFLPALKSFSEPETTVIKNMCSLWTNFAKNGNPSTPNLNGIEWRQYTDENPCFLRIDKSCKLIEKKLREKEFAFWTDLLKPSHV